MMKIPISLNKFSKYSWGVLAFNVLVILWGAFVRATGSGAGCGSHWPICQGEIIPTNPQIDTLIEFTHRISSGVAFLLVLAMFVFARKVYPKKHPVRLGAGLSMFFIITEALVGAALVKFEWVAQDVSMGRVISTSIHLVNTFLLLASITLTAWWASWEKRLSFQNHQASIFGLSLALLLVIMLGVSGAITALGDTLFPSETLAAGLSQDFSPTAHFIVRLRVWHPLIAIFTGLYIILIALFISTADDQKIKNILALTLGGLVIIQLAAGVINLFLLAPIPMQLIHLLLADMVWIALILFSAVTLTPEISQTNDLLVNKDILFEAE